MPFQISSPHNEHIKSLLRLEKRAERDLRRVTLVEGVREVERALAAGHLPVEAWVCPPLVQGEGGQAALQRLLELDAQRCCRVYEVPPPLFERLAVRGQSGGLLLVIPYVTRPLAELKAQSNALVLVIEAVEKPGNLGAILRTADAAGVTAVLVCDGATDVHNPNVVRASLGTLFHLPICEATSAETDTWLRANGLRIVAASPYGTVDYTQADLSGPLALVFGAEAAGLSALWGEGGATLVRIPMAGIADSLNVSTAAAILLFEAVRQRRSGPPAP